MGDQIVVYNANFPQKSGSFFITKKTKFQRLARSLGILFLALSIIGILLFFLPIVKSELQYRQHLLRKQDEELRSKFSLILSPNENQFELIIPKVGIKTQVFTNVNPSNEQEYKKILADNAAHATGSNLPGEGGMVYIFGHSTNSVFDLRYYNPVFYLLNKLDLGDEVGIIHKGKVYIYQVAERKVVKPNDLSDIKPDSNQEKLILQTCWPPGTDWKRLLVIAYPELKT